LSASGIEFLMQICCMVPPDRSEPHMVSVPQGWRVYPGSAPESALERLKRPLRSLAASYRYHRALGLPKPCRFAMTCAVVAVASAGSATAGVALMSLSPWPPAETLRHLASFPNCNAARANGVAPARRGEPGYWKRHDRDRDGIACEPWPRTLRSAQ
jgi:hypothetical protein